MTADSHRDPHEPLVARLAAGERLEAHDEMSPVYRQSLIHLMTMQADSELAGAYGYVPWITKAPTVEEKLVVAQIVKDETRHAKVMYDLLTELGVDVGQHVAAHDRSFAVRLEDSEADIGTARISADKRVNIFYYPIDTWADFVMFNFCMDRGAGHQLEDVRTSSYGPWRRGVEGIFKEEKMHIRHGELWVRRLADNPATRPEATRTFGKWFVRTMNNLRPAGQSEEPSLPRAAPQGSGQRRGAPGLRRRGARSRGAAGLEASRVAPPLGEPPGRGPDPGLGPPARPGARHQGGRLRAALAAPPGPAANVR